MKVLSLFDGMSCGMLAMLGAGLSVERYVAYEIDKYAVQTSTHNFPIIEQKGDVFQADFTEYQGFDFLVGGSPCTYWSIAQKNNRETEASGMGWELFSQYVRALREAKPKYFIYENNKSMSKAIRESITETFGFEPVCINSALVSAQNRQRLYWVGKQNADGTYSKVRVDQPLDRGILLKDILDGVTDREKGRCLLSSSGRTTTREYFDKNQGTMAYEPVDATKHRANRVGGFYGQVTRWGIYGTDGKTPTLTAAMGMGGGHIPMVTESVPSTVLNVNPSGNGINGAVGRIDAKTRCLTTNKGEGQKIIVPVADPVGCAYRGRMEDGKWVKQYEVREDEKTNAITTAQTDSMVSEPILCAIQSYTMKVQEATAKGYTEINPGECVDMTQPNSKTRRGRNMADKSNCLMTSCQYYQYCGVLGYATPCEWDENGRPTKAVSAADGKTYTVYEVKDGQITIKGKQYPIKLVDGLYIIRKLTVTECMRLQTVPEWYEFPVSDSQAYKMLGNGWTVEVIIHLINSIMADEPEDGEQLRLF